MRSLKLEEFSKIREESDVWKSSLNLRSLKFEEFSNLRSLMLEELSNLRSLKCLMNSQI